MITFTRTATEFHERITQITDRREITGSFEYTYLHRDIESMVALKKGLMQIRQKKIGSALLKA